MNTVFIQMKSLFSRRTVYRFATLFLAYSLCTGCVAGPSIAGFMHPDPAPPNGQELALGITGGGGYAGFGFGDLGAGLSYAGRVEDVGVSLAAWCVAPNFIIANYGSHLEVAIPVGSDQDEKHSSGNDDTVYLLTGAGFAASFASFFRPQLSFGAMQAPPPDAEGLFGGGRIHGGTNLSHGNEPYESYFHPAASLTGSIGYRWILEESKVNTSLQFVPIFDFYYPSIDGFPFTFAGQLLLTFGFPMT